MVFNQFSTILHSNPILHNSPTLIQFLSQINLSSPKKSHAYSKVSTNTLFPQQRSAGAHAHAHSSATRTENFCGRFRFAARTSWTLDPANSAQRGLCACVYIESLYIENRSGACSTRCYIRLSLLSQYYMYIQTDQRSGAFTVKQSMREIFDEIICFILLLLLGSISWALILGMVLLLVRS